MDATDINPAVSFDTLDLAALTRVPVLNLESYVSLIRALEGVAFDHAMLERPRARMAKGVGQGEAILVARLGDEVDVNLERKFDYFVDRVWAFVRSELDFWALYLHEGVGLLSEAERAKIDLDQSREYAEVAGDLLERLFGTEGSEFLRRSYPQQAEGMRSRLQLIETKGLGQTFVTLVGPRLAALVQVCQERYDAMVVDRSSRSTGPIGDRNVLNRRLKRAIQMYAHAVIGTLDEEAPNSAIQVERALRPLVLANVPRKINGESSEGVQPGLSGDVATQGMEVDEGSSASGEEVTNE